MKSFSSNFDRNLSHDSTKFGVTYLIRFSFLLSFIFAPYIF